MEKKAYTPALRFRSLSGSTITYNKYHLSDVCSRLRSGENIPASKITKTGKYPVFGGNGLRGYTSLPNFIGECAIVGRQGALCGNVHYFTGTAYMTEHAIVACTLPEHNIKYLSYLLTTMHLEKLSTQSAQPGLSVENLSKQIIKMPSRNVQDKVAQMLTALGDMIDSGAQKITKLEQFRQAMLMKLFPAEGASEPALRFRGFSGPWKKERLGNIVDIQSGQDYKNLGPGTIPVYGTGGYMLSVDHALSYDKDAIGIGRKGTIDKPYILHAPFWTVDTLFYVLPQEGLDLNFAYAVFQKINWKALDESTGVPSLSKINIGNVVTYFPTYLEQQKIGNFFHWLDSYISLQKEKLDKMRLLKAALLDKLFV